MIKKAFWKAAYVCYPYIRDFLLLTRIMQHNGRQNFHIGFLKEGKTVHDLKKLLAKTGFEKSVLAWIDDDEVLSMRKRTSGIYQHHVRLYTDREVKGHYEYAPESKPRKHLKGIMFEPEKIFFEKLLGGVVTSKASSE